ncbi:hypothetical protein SynSYN20_00559 [Synechococcus sp. SYN20]|nr:hypothetical protein SynMVIR181_00534 [Synechococcus sp. MVIR-18-1]QNJ24910.1 hypothetical protein SynSYN20_00559 [Synechococcus sp. SYN20]
MRVFQELAPLLLSGIFPDLRELKVLILRLACVSSEGCDEVRDGGLA